MSSKGNSWQSISLLREIFGLMMMLSIFMGCTQSSENTFAVTNAVKQVVDTLEITPTYCCPASTPKVIERENTSQYLFGVLNDAGDHYEDEWAHGVRATNLELHWDKYEIEEGVYDSQYINHLRELMVYLKGRGWYVQLVPGYHYVPGWVFANYPDSYLTNQYGELYNPDPGADHDIQAINAAFNPQARALIAKYLEHILTESFPQDDPDYRFDSIRLGGGPQGELRYPTKDWNGHTNSYWAFDSHAQDPAISGIPEAIVGWRPGIDPNPGSEGHGQLIVNPGFEETHGYYPLVGWSADDEVGAWLDPEFPHSGSYAIKVIIQSPHRVYQFVRVEARTEYEVGAWLRSFDGLGHARLFLTQYDANTNLIASSPFIKLESSLTTWQYAEANITTLDSTRFLKVEVDGDRAGIYTFDDLQLMKVGELDDRTREISIPTAFYDWYVKKLIDFQNWQIDEVRKYFDGQLDILYPGKGIQDKQIMGALTNDLAGDGWSESLSALYAGTDFQRHVNGLEVRAGIALYVTGIDIESQDQVDDKSLHPSEWSAAHWIAHLARSNGLSVWGENSGEDSAEKLWLSAKRMHENNFIGMMWGFEAELYDDQSGYATIDNYKDVIDFYSNLQTFYISIIFHK